MEPKTDFDFYLKFVKPLVLNLPNRIDRQKAAAWAKRLRDDQALDEPTRLSYIKLLLFVLQRNTLAGIFRSHPHAVETVEPFPEGQTLLDVAKVLIEQEFERREEETRKRLRGESGDIQPYISDFSPDLREYVAIQDIKEFGVHGLYAISKEPLINWKRVDKSTLPKAAKSVIEVTAGPPTLTGTLSASQLTQPPKAPAGDGPQDKKPPEEPPKTEEGGEETKPPEEEEAPQEEGGEEKPPVEEAPPIEPKRERSRSPKRKSNLGASPPSSPIGRVKPPELDREPPTWGSNLLEVKKVFEREEQLDSMEVIWSAGDEDKEGSSPQIDNTLDTRMRGPQSPQSPKSPNKQIKSPSKKSPSRRSPQDRASRMLEEFGFTDEDFAKLNLEDLNLELDAIAQNLTPAEEEPISPDKLAITREAEFAEYDSFLAQLEQEHAADMAEFQDASDFDDNAQGQIGEECVEDGDDGEYGEDGGEEGEDYDFQMPITDAELEENELQAQQLMAQIHAEQNQIGVPVEDQIYELPDPYLEGYDQDQDQPQSYSSKETTMTARYQGDNPEMAAELRRLGMDPEQVSQFVQMSQEGAVVDVNVESTENEDLPPDADLDGMLDRFDNAYTGPTDQGQYEEEEEAYGPTGELTAVDPQQIEEPPQQYQQPCPPYPQPSPQQQQSRTPQRPQRSRLPTPGGRSGGQRQTRTVTEVTSSTQMQGGSRTMEMRMETVDNRGGPEGPVSNLQAVAPGTQRRGGIPRPTGRRVPQPQPQVPCIPQRAPAPQRTGIPQRRPIPQQPPPRRIAAPPTPGRGAPMNAAARARSRTSVPPPPQPQPVRRPPCKPTTFATRGIPQHSATRARSRTSVPQQEVPQPSNALVPRRPSSSKQGFPLRSAAPRPRPAPSQRPPCPPRAPPRPQRPPCPQRPPTAPTTFARRGIPQNAAARARSRTSVPPQPQAPPQAPRIPQRRPAPPAGTTRRGPPQNTAARSRTSIPPVVAPVTKIPPRGRPPLPPLVPTGDEELDEFLQTERKIMGHDQPVPAEQSIFTSKKAMQIFRQWQDDVRKSLADKDIYLEAPPTTGQIGVSSRIARPTSRIRPPSGTVRQPGAIPQLTAPSAAGRRPSATTRRPPPRRPPTIRPAGTRATRLRATAQTASLRPSATETAIRRPSTTDTASRRPSATATAARRPSGIATLTRAPPCPQGSRRPPTVPAGPRRLSAAASGIRRPSATQATRPPPKLSSSLIPAKKPSQTIPRKKPTPPLKKPCVPRLQRKKSSKTTVKASAATGRRTGLPVPQGKVPQRRLPPPPPPKPDPRYEVGPYDPIGTLSPPKDLYYDEDQEPVALPGPLQRFPRPQFAPVQSEHYELDIDEQEKQEEPFPLQPLDPNAIQRYTPVAKRYLLDEMGGDLAGLPDEERRREIRRRIKQFRADYTFGPLNEAKRVVESTDTEIRPYYKSVLSDQDNRQIRPDDMEYYNIDAEQLEECYDDAENYGQPEGPQYGPQPRDIVAEMNAEMLRRQQELEEMEAAAQLEPKEEQEYDWDYDPGKQYPDVSQFTSARTKRQQVQQSLGERAMDETSCMGYEVINPEYYTAEDVESSYIQDDQDVHELSDRAYVRGTVNKQEMDYTGDVEVTEGTADDATMEYYETQTGAEGERENQLQEMAANIQKLGWQANNFEEVLGRVGPQSRNRLAGTVETTTTRTPGQFVRSDNVKMEKSYVYPEEDECADGGGSPTDSDFRALKRDLEDYNYYQPSHDITVVPNPRGGQMMTVKRHSPLPREPLRTNKHITDPNRSKSGRQYQRAKTRMAGMMRDMASIEEAHEEPSQRQRSQSAQQDRQVILPRIPQYDNLNGYPPPDQQIMYQNEQIERNLPPFSDRMGLLMDRIGEAALERGLRIRRTPPEPRTQYKPYQSTPTRIPQPSSNYWGENVDWRPRYYGPELPDQPQDEQFTPSSYQYETPERRMPEQEAAPDIICPEETIQEQQQNLEVSSPTRHGADLNNVLSRIHDQVSQIESRRGGSPSPSPEQFAEDVAQYIVEKNLDDPNAEGYRGDMYEGLKMALEQYEPTSEDMEVYQDIVEETPRRQGGGQAYDRRIDFTMNVTESFQGGISPDGNNQETAPDDMGCWPEGQQ